MKKIKILKKTVKEKQTVYDLAVKDSPHYILENGILSHNSFIPQQVLAGGGGIKFASDYIFMLSKAKHKEGTETTGGIITSKALKNRDAKPETKIQMLLSFKHGLHKYYGLVPFAIEAGILTEESGKYVYKGKKYSEKMLYQNAAEIFTEDVLKQLDVTIGNHFHYGSESSEGLFAESGEDDSSTQSDD